MADEPAVQPEPQAEPPAAPEVDLKTQIATVLRELLSEAQAQRDPEPQPTRPGSLQGVAALEAEAATNPAAQVILDIGAALADQAQQIRVLKERVNAGPKIPPERLAEAETEFRTGKYASLEDADAAAVGRKFLSGQVQPTPPKPRQVATAVRTVTQPVVVEELNEMTASQFREALKGPKSREVHKRYMSGAVKVVQDA